MKNQIAVLPALSQVRITCDRNHPQQSNQETDLRVCSLSGPAGGETATQVGQQITLPLGGNFVLKNDTPRDQIIELDFYYLDQQGNRYASHSVSMSSITFPNKYST